MNKFVFLFAILFFVIPCSFAADSEETSTVGADSELNRSEEYINESDDSLVIKNEEETSASKENNSEQ